MSTTEPNGWELKRSIDQLRADVEKKLDANRADAKEDTKELSADINGIGTKIDAKFDDLERRFPTRSDHNALVARVTTLETRADKRSERTSTQWLAWGTTAFAALVAVVMGVIALVSR